MSGKEQLVHQLAAIERVLSERIEFWRVVIDVHGRELRRIYRGSFYRPRGTEPQERKTR